jgi:hypothetical protein
VPNRWANEENVLAALAEYLVKLTVKDPRALVVFGGRPVRLVRDGHPDRAAASGSRTEAEARLLLPPPP